MEENQPQARDKRKNKKKGPNVMSPWELHLLMLCTQGMYDCELCEAVFDMDFCPEGYCPDTI